MKRMKYKYVTKSDVFKRLLYKAGEIFNKPTSIFQVNYYYDDNDYSLNKKNINIRIKKLDGKLFLETIEYSSTDTMYSSLEVSSLPQNINHEKSKKPIYLVGSMATYREKFITLDDIQINFDVNYYIDVCDFEIEFIFNQSNSKRVNELIKEMYIIDDISNKGKASRFFERTCNN